MVVSVKMIDVFLVVRDIAVTVTCHMAGHKLFVAGSAMLKLNSNHFDNSNTYRRCQHPT
jgi:hypothetical protein